MSAHKKSGYFVDLSPRYGWLKNPAIWLAENNLALVSETKFPKYGIFAGTQQTIEIFIIEQIQ